MVAIGHMKNNAGSQRSQKLPEGFALLDDLSKGCVGDVRTVAQWLQAGGLYTPVVGISLMGLSTVTLFTTVAAN